MAQKQTFKKRVRVPRTPENMKRVLQQAGLLDAFRLECARTGQDSGLVMLEAAAGIAILSQDPAETKQALVEAAKEAGIDPVLRHAIEKTGRMLTEDNMKFLSETELEEWNDAIEEGRRLFGHESTRGR